MAGTREHRDHECVFARGSRHEGKGVGKSLAGRHAVPPLPGERYSACVFGIALRPRCGAQLEYAPHFVYSDPAPRNLVLADYVAQDLLFNEVRQVPKLLASARLLLRGRISIGCAPAGEDAG